MILEGILTTSDDAGGMHVAAMGPEIAEPARASGRVEGFVLRPFATSQTSVHLARRPAGVFHLTDDVLLVARLAAGIPVRPPARPAGAVPGWVLDDACQAWEFVVERSDASQPRVRLDARVVAVHAGRPFLGFNRAAHAVVEAAILITRLHLLERSEVHRRLADLEPLVTKTGGAAEREAFALLAARARAG